MTQSHTDIFGGQERKFLLRAGELRELQDRCSAGPATIVARLMSYQPQAANTRRPDPLTYAGGEIDDDFLADLNVFGLMRSIGGDWRVEDVRETIRLGLIGGGMTPTDAFIAIAQYVDSRPLAEHIGLAAAIILAAISGDKGDPAGNAQTERVKETQATA